MAFCPACRQAVTETMNYCPACGARQRPEFAPPPVYLDDVLHHCVQCGREEAFGKLTKCGVCHDRACADCTRACPECQGPACAKCVVDCEACKRSGCARCYSPCDVCGVRAMCPDHVGFCEDCQYATCRECTKHCERCDLDVCSLCLEEAHEPKRKRDHLHK